MKSFLIQLRAELFMLGQGLKAGWDPVLDKLEEDLRREIRAQRLEELDAVEHEAFLPKKKKNQASWRDRLIQVAGEEFHANVIDRRTLLKSMDRIEGYIQEGLGWKRTYEKDGDFAWCGAFVAYLYSRVGLRHALRLKHMASCHRLRKAADRGIFEEVQGVADACPGDIVVVGPANGRAWGQHIGLFLQYDAYEEEVFLLEGNAYAFGPGYGPPPVGKVVENLVEHAKQTKYASEYREGVGVRKRPIAPRIPNEYAVKFIYRIKETDLSA